MKNDRCHQESFEVQIDTLEQVRDAVRQVFQHFVSTPLATASPHISATSLSSHQEWWHDSASEPDTPPHETSTVGFISLVNAPLFIHQPVQDCQCVRTLFQQRLLDSEKSPLLPAPTCRAIHLQYTPNSEQKVQLTQCDKDERIWLAEISKDKDVELARIASEECIVLAKVGKDIKKFAKDKEVRKTEVFAEMR
ncbi:hypothetical protein BGZ81_009141 [Podila clonocystis]|nr:hypothetical protein BGZ81_009141 [Podila clonocystis]